MTAGEERAIEATNGLRRAVTIGLAGFLLCLGLSYQVPDLARKLTDPMEDKARKEYLAAHPVNHDELPEIDTSNMSDEEMRAAIIDAVVTALAKSSMASFDGYMKEVAPGLEKKAKLIKFGLLAGTGLLAALFGLATLAGWTLIQSRRLADDLAGAVYRVALPHVDFNQTLLFSSRNFKELLVWTAGWLAAPVAIAVGLADDVWGRSIFGGLYPLAVIVGSFYIFSFWLTLAVYARRGQLADPGGEYVKFESRVLLLCLFFTFAPLLQFPLDLIFGLLILFDFLRSYFKAPASAADI